MGVKHTPTPWSYAFSKSLQHCVKFGEKNICWSMRTKEDAEFIVHCVNQHAQLVEALKEANAWISRGDGLSPAKRGATCETLSDATDKIEAALAAEREGE